jgi:hypothetical protein
VRPECRPATTLEFAVGASLKCTARDLKLSFTDAARFAGISSAFVFAGTLVVKADIARASDANACGSSCANARASSAWVFRTLRKEQRVHSIQIPEEFGGSLRFRRDRENFAIRFRIVPGVTQFRIRLEHTVQLCVVSFRIRIWSVIRRDIQSAVVTARQLSSSFHVRKKIVGTRFWSGDENDCASAISSLCRKLG